MENFINSSLHMLLLWLVDNVKRAATTSSRLGLFVLHSIWFLVHSIINEVWDLASVSKIIDMISPILLTNSYIKSVKKDDYSPFFILYSLILLVEFYLALVHIAFDTFLLSIRGEGTSNYAIRNYSSSLQFFSKFYFMPTF